MLELTSTVRYSVAVLSALGHTETPRLSLNALSRSLPAWHRFTLVTPTNGEQIAGCSRSSWHPAIPNAMQSKRKPPDGGHSEYRAKETVKNYSARFHVLLARRLESVPHARNVGYVTGRKRGTIAQTSSYRTIQ